MEQFIANMAAGALGGGVLASILYWALIGKLRERFVQKDEVLRMVPCMERLQRIERLEETLPQLDNHGARLQSLEDRLVSPLARMMERQDRMVERDAQRDILLERTATSLQQVAATVERMESRVDDLSRRVDDNRRT